MFQPERAFIVLTAFKQIKVTKLVLQYDLCCLLCTSFDNILIRFVVRHILLLNHMLTYCINVEVGKIVLKCKNSVRIEHLFKRKSLLSS